MLKITLSRRGMTTRQVRRFGFFVKQSMINAAKRWRKETLPGHFKRGAGNKYKFQRRTTAYQKRKRRRGLGPMEWTGKAKRRILADRREPTGSAKKITLRIPVFGWFHRKYRNWKHPMKDELKKVTNAEAQQLADEVAEECAKLMTEETQFERIVYGGF